MPNPFRRALPTTLCALLLMVGVSCESVRTSKMRIAEGGEKLGSRLLDTSPDKRSQFDKRTDLKKSFAKGKGIEKGEARLGGSEIASEYINRQGNFAKKEFSGRGDGTSFAGQNFYGAGVEAELPDRPLTPLFSGADKRPRGTGQSERGWSGGGETFDTGEYRGAAKARENLAPPIIQHSSDSSIGIGQLKEMLNKGGG